MARRIKVDASSSSTPVGSPAASFTMTPLGDVVSRVIPARASAFELAHTAWNENSFSTTGLSGAA